MAFFLGVQKVSYIALIETYLGLPVEEKIQLQLILLRKFQAI